MDEARDEVMLEEPLPPPRPARTFRAVRGVARILVVIASTVAWPAIQLGVFVVRFHHLPPGGIAESLVFAPMGLVAGVVAVLLLGRASSARQARGVAYGYLIAAPLAFLGGLLGGLIVPGVWGPLAFCAAPLAIGCLVGFIAGGARKAST